MFHYRPLNFGKVKNLLNLLPNLFNNNIEVVLKSTENLLFSKKYIVKYLLNKTN